METATIHTTITAHPFLDEDLFFVQETLREAELCSVFRRAEAATVVFKNGDSYILSRSIKSENYLWQLTFIHNNESVSDVQCSTILDVARELPEKGIKKIVYEPNNNKREVVKPMQYIASYYISPNGTKVVDGLNSIADTWSLTYARNALVSANFVQQVGEGDEMKFFINGSPLTTAQIRTMQDTVYDALRAGHDVCIETLDGRSTTLVEENTYNIAQICGYLLTHDDFAHGDYVGQRDQEERRELEASLARSEKARQVYSSRYAAER